MAAKVSTWTGPLLVGGVAFGLGLLLSGHARPATDVSDSGIGTRVRVGDRIEVDTTDVTRFRQEQAVIQGPGQQFEVLAYEPYPYSSSPRAQSFNLITGRHLATGVIMKFPAWAVTRIF